MAPGGEDVARASPHGPEAALGPGSGSPRRPGVAPRATHGFRSRFRSLFRTLSCAHVPSHRPLCLPAPTRGAGRRTRRLPDGSGSLSFGTERATRPAPHQLGIPELGARFAASAFRLQHGGPSLATKPKNRARLQGSEIHGTANKSVDRPRLWHAEGIPQVPEKPHGRCDIRIAAAESAPASTYQQRPATRWPKTQSGDDAPDVRMTL